MFLPTGLVPKAARLPCKQAFSERYRAGPRKLVPRPSCAAARLPMQHDGRAPRWYRGGFGSTPNVGSVSLALPTQHDGRAPHIRRGGFGSIPNVGSASSFVARAARWPCTSLVTRRVRFDSERGLDIRLIARAAQWSCTSLVTRWVRFDSERGLR